MQPSNHTATGAPLWRRLAAAVYDFLLVGAIWFVTAGIMVALLNHFQLMENYHGVGRPPEWMLHIILFPLLILEAWAFYAWFWCHGGQTLGMKSWRLRVVHNRGGRLSLWQTLARFIGAWLSLLLAGGGYLLVLFPPHQSLHDRLSATATVVHSKDG